MKYLWKLLLLFLVTLSVYVVVAEEPEIDSSSINDDSKVDTLEPSLDAPRPLQPIPPAEAPTAEEETASFSPPPPPPPLPKFSYKARSKPEPVTHSDPEPDSDAADPSPRPIPPPSPPPLPPLHKVLSKPRSKPEPVTHSNPEPDSNAVDPSRGSIPPLSPPPPPESSTFTQNNKLNDSDSTILPVVGKKRTDRVPKKILRPQGLKRLDFEGLKDTIYAGSEEPFALEDKEKYDGLFTQDKTLKKEAKKLGGKKARGFLEEKRRMRVAIAMATAAKLLNEDVNIPPEKLLNSIISFDDRLEEFDGINTLLPTEGECVELKKCLINVESMPIADQMIAKACETDSLREAAELKVDMKMITSKMSSLVDNVKDCTDSMKILLDSEGFKKLVVKANQLFKYADSEFMNVPSGALAFKIEEILELEAYKSVDDKMTLLDLLVQMFKTDLQVMTLPESFKLLSRSSTFECRELGLELKKIVKKIQELEERSSKMSVIASGSSSDTFMVKFAQYFVKATKSLSELDQNIKNIDNDVSNMETIWLKVEKYLANQPILCPPKVLPQEMDTEKDLVKMRGLVAVLSKQDIYLKECPSGKGKSRVLFYAIDVLMKLLSVGIQKQRQAEEAIARIEARKAAAIENARKAAEIERARRDKEEEESKRAAEIQKSLIARAKQRALKDAAMEDARMMQEMEMRVQRANQEDYQRSMLRDDYNRIILNGNNQMAILPDDYLAAGLEVNYQVLPSSGLERDYQKLMPLKTFDQRTLQNVQDGERTKARENQKDFEPNPVSSFNDNFYRKWSQKEETYSPTRFTLYKER